MNFNKHSTEKEDSRREIGTDDVSSIEDFIRELEEKEKDLDISAGTVVEIEESVVEIEDYAAAPSVIFDAPSAAPENDFPPNRSFLRSPAAANSLETELVRLRGQISKLEKEKAETSEAARRKSFDYENFRKRVEREKGEVFRALIGNVGAQLLPVLDNLSRALDSASRIEGAKTIDFARFIDGIELVDQQLAEILSEMGIRAIPAVGEPFDPHFHEAVAVVPTAEFPPQTVVAEILRGYCLDDKVIRHAMVKVSAPLGS